MRWEANNLAALAGLVASLALHVTVLTPGLTGTGERVADPVPVELLEVAIEPPEPEVRLGVARSTAETATWIGHDERPQEHLAPLAAVEQAAFTDQPGEIEDLEPAPITATNASQQAPAEANAAPPAPRAPEGGPAVEAAEAQPPADDLWAQMIERYTAALAQAIDEPAPLAPLPSPPPAPALAPPPEPAAAQEDGEGGGESGELSDRQSDATSTVLVPIDALKAGRPLAARGLEIATRKPSFTTLMLLTASPANPLVVLHFGGDGRPRLASLIEGSGDDRVDEAILSSLYRWRAAGEDLAALRGTETVDVRIRILLGRSRS